MGDVPRNAGRHPIGIVFRGDVMDARPVGHALRAIVYAVIAMLAVVNALQAADPSAGRNKAKVCRTCHGIDGVGKMPTVPNIAGESEIYLAKQLKAFRSGERKDPQMSIIAKPLTDEEIANLAAWYASIKFSVTVPE
jgi:cytochrome c553